jgi:hypothetical protein
MVLNGSGGINKVSGREHQDLLLSPSIIFGALTEYDFATAQVFNPIHGFCGDRTRVPHLRAQPNSSFGLMA